MQTRYRLFSLIFLLCLAALAACGGVEQPEPFAPEMGPIVPFGSPEVRDLGPTTEIVPNCDGVTSPVIKNPSRTVGSSHSVEWQVGGIVGAGLTIGKGVVPGGVDLQAALEGHVANDLTNIIQQGDAWELPADPDTIMEYTIMWREVWQPGYIDLTFIDPEPEIMRIDVRYRTGVRSEIVGQRRSDCDSGTPGVVLEDVASGQVEPTEPTAVELPPTNTPALPPPTNTPAPLPPTNTPIPPQPTEPVSSTSFEVYASLSWQDTGVRLSPGDRVRVIWDGKSRWRGINSGDFSDPLGGYSDPNANYGCPPLMPSAEAGWNAMVAKVGDGGTVTNPFKVPPMGEGTLYLAMNDCDEQRYDNEGSAVVTIEVRR